MSVRMMVMLQAYREYQRKRRRSDPAFRIGWTERIDLKFIFIFRYLRTKFIYKNIKGSKHPLIFTLFARTTVQLSNQSD